MLDGYIKGVLQEVLNKNFSNKNRQVIIEHHNRLNCACPYCGDGKSEYKKRFNIYDNLFAVCFNCDKRTSFERFCKDFSISIDPDKKLEIIKYYEEKVSYNDYKSDIMESSIDLLIDMKDLEEAVRRNITHFTEFGPIIKNGGVYKYLLGRGISEDKHENIYQAKYWITEDKYQWVIISLNRRGDKILGLQVRNLKSGKNRMFKIYNYENLLEWVNLVRETPIDVDSGEIAMYNKLSYYYNILNLNFSKKVTVFEGYIDSLFYPNSIGLVGVNTDYRILESIGLDLQYFFDNDEAGNIKTSEKIRAGYPSFLWNKLFKSVVENKRDKDPYRLMYRIKKVKDINKLAELVPEPYINLKLYNFFSRDIYDLSEVDQVKKKTFFY